MGYQINSTWARFHEKDINRLNEIIDNEYCNELEIERKLNIMHRFEDMFDKEIENLNWNSILKFMEDNNWQWAFYDNGSNYRVPTKAEIITRLRNDYFKHSLYHIIELGETHYAIFSGRFSVELGYEGTNYWVNIYFDIAHFWEDEL